MRWSRYGGHCDVMTGAGSLRAIEVLIAERRVELNDLFDVAAPYIWTTWLSGTSCRPLISMA
jgi:hypothetical protein